ncbi:unnamed protein product [Closterium sp. Naga37s-1]|nr:unnamed protein product [Closterium sp. Naga37s-1]
MPPQIASYFISFQQLTLSLTSLPFLLYNSILIRGPKRNIRFIKADRIEEFSVLGKTEEIASLRLPYVDLAVLHAKEDAAVRKAEGEAERIGVGVTAEAQDIFFALCKT